MKVKIMNISETYLMQRLVICNGCQDWSFINCFSLGIKVVILILSLRWVFFVQFFIVTNETTTLD